MTPINNSPVCKCAVPSIPTDDKPEGSHICNTCHLIIPKEVKCCECFAANIQKSDYRGNVCACKCHSTNMTEVMEKVDKMIGGAVRRLGSEEFIEGQTQHVMGLEAPNTEAREDMNYWLHSYMRQIPLSEEVLLKMIEDILRHHRKELESEKNKAREALKNHLQNIINEFGGNAEQCLAILEEILAGKTDVEL